MGHLAASGAHGHGRAMPEESTHSRRFPTRLGSPLQLNFDDALWSARLNMLESRKGGTCQRV